MKIIIVGNGIAGSTAAQRIRQLDASAEICMISNETDAFFSRPALMYAFMNQMPKSALFPYEAAHWKSLNIHLLRIHVGRIFTDKNEILLSNGKVQAYDQLILALGSRPRQILPKSNRILHFYSWQDLEKLEEIAKTSQKICVVGGGLIGVEVAEMFLAKGIEVHFLIRESSFYYPTLPLEEGGLIAQEMANMGVKTYFETEVDEVLSSESGVQVLTKNQAEINCDYVVECVGVEPNISVETDSKININKGIVVNQYLQTNVENVWAVGDCVEHQTAPKNRRNIEQIWYAAKAMGHTVAANVLGGKESYEPGTFFNSAKFFNIEYQVYGRMEFPLKDEVQSVLYQNKNQLIRVHLLNGHIIGMHALGFRIRGEAAMDMIENRRGLIYLIHNLKSLDFNPEFSKINWKDIKRKFEHEIQ